MLVSKLFNFILNAKLSVLPEPSTGNILLGPSYVTTTPLTGTISIVLFGTVPVAEALTPSVLLAG